MLKDCKNFLRFLAPLFLLMLIGFIVLPPLIYIIQWWMSLWGL